MTDLTIAENTVASVHYTGTLPDSGEVFDSSEGRDPLTFLVGHKQMIPGFEEEMMGACLLYTSPSPRDGLLSRMPSSA